ncbi:MAG: Ca2+-dependent phosphoinositide-specific phospholipase C [Planctomycetota bacterium]|nr:Ca2+-dependent phosphoinositide-specific phospholipase C [Planctomycetota bacterium]MDA1106446.1 Ca2+-dependent phosphoinositide-specific phospholipase C [Planctomycetota bacterium]
MSAPRAAARLLRVGVAGLIVLGLSRCEDRPQSVTAPGASMSTLRLDDVQWIGTHNSYHTAPPVTLYKQFDDRAVAWDYTHPPLAAQLDAGLRALELDVYADDDARFASPLGTIPPETRDAFKEPGLKVFHVPDIDQGSTCPTLRGCLDDLASWSAAHPGHLPVFVMLECVAREVGDRGPFTFTKAERWEDRHLAELESALLETLGADRLITPDEVRGSAHTLAQALASEGWPLVDQLRGRFLFVITNDAGVIAMQRARHPGLRGSPCFVEVDETDPDCAILVLNNPVNQRETIDRARARRVLVRTRADSELEEVRTGATARRDAALASGANIISSDAPAAIAGVAAARSAGKPAAKPAGASPPYSVGFPEGATVRVHPRSDRDDAGLGIDP